MLQTCTEIPGIVKQLSSFLLERYPAGFGFSNKVWYVYSVTAPNGKMYIGKTNNQKMRRQSHTSRARQGKHDTKFGRALVKYGDTMDWSTLAGVHSEELAFAIEDFYVRHFNTTDPKYGYNTIAGGSGAYSGHLRSTTFKENLRNKRLGKNNPMYGVPAPTRRRVLCTTTGEIFESLSAAAKKYNLTLGNVCNVCKKRATHTKGYSFEYLEVSNDHA